MGQCRKSPQKDTNTEYLGYFEVKELTDRELVSPSQLSPQLGVAPTALQNVIQRVLAQSREKCATQRETEVYQKKSE